ncbi:S-adenosyl-L-methionine-dependent methyltransferase [Pseudovirgaria hyperparasitica]|uniref:S-adenosyl-L-methionine-dependent methyltransferase n=1 Tax=Pseudovirgaria hyperparasitica TaxID=470096 RepID=A0A6A6W856_9PEZI|nr:S-adenosyl-L-methionine-dependent methyltransferase [Pseudovirgaria hyperparasitica]KAF2757261.1 S-adenosyl-L-methionine-dependent methyltransferase [Pseudovirgaria hyperparasitica]
MSPPLQDATERCPYKADTDDKHRAAYPLEAVEDLLNNLKISGRQGAHVLDLGAGTGKFTEELSRRNEKFSILAVEPQKDMRLQLEAKNLPNVEVKAGHSHGIPVQENGVFDAVIAAESFHWYADSESLDEIWRVLKPGGTLGMIWNIDDYNQTRRYHVQTEWEGKLRDLTWTFDDATPRFRHEKWQKVFDSQLNLLPVALVKKGNSEFTLPIGKEMEKWVWTSELSKEDLWNRYSTLSQVAVLEGENLTKFKETFDAIVDGPDVEKTEDGMILTHGVTPIAWTTKLLDGAPIDSSKDMDTAA